MDISPPQWCNLKPAKLGLTSNYTGRSDGVVSSSEALLLAQSEAINQFTQEMGVTLESNSLAIQKEINGKLETNVRVSVSSRSEPITIRGLKLTRRFVAKQSASKAYAACVEITIPRQEVSRLKLLALNKAALKLDCLKDNIKASCSAATTSRIEEMLNKQNIALAGRVTGELSAALANAKSLHAAHLFTLELQTKFLGEEHGEFYAESVIVLKKFSTSDGQTLKTIALAPQKGGHFSKEESMSAAVEEALNTMTERLRQKALE